MIESPDKSPVEAEFIISPFINLLADAINFCHLAENPSLTHSARSSLVRASILNCVFALECAANVLLKNLDISKYIYSQFERLPILDKFEAILLLISPAHEFDRGTKEVQAIKELISLRNDQVHIKSKRQELVGQSINDAWWTFEPRDKVVTNILKIPESSDRWDSSHGIIALQALDTFLKLFLIDWAHLEPTHVSSILLSHVIYGDKGAVLMPEDSYSTLKLGRKNMRLKLNFMDLEVPNVRVSIIDEEVKGIITRGTDEKM